MLASLIGAIIGGTVAIILNPQWPIEELAKYAFWSGIVGGILGMRIQRLFEAPRNTVNYTLYRGRKRVYEGVTYFRRLPKRLDEHRQSGKRFSRVLTGKPTTRKRALAIEKKRIHKYKPRYNVAHKF